MVLIKKSGFGKNQAMRTLLIDYNRLLILDHMNWKDILRETKLSIFDKDRVAKIRIVYKCILLFINLIKINFVKNINDSISDLSI